MKEMIKSFLKDIKRIGLVTVIGMVALSIMLIISIIATPVVFVGNILDSVFGMDSSEILAEDELYGGRLVQFYTQKDNKIKPMLQKLTDERILQNKAIIVVIMFGLNDYNENSLKEIIQCLSENTDEQVVKKLQTLPSLQGRSLYDDNYFLHLLKTSSDTYQGGPTNIKGLSKREKSPADERTNPNYFSNKNWYHASGLDGQCTWYTIGRVMEMAEQIDYSLNMEDLRVLRHNGADFIDDAMNQSTYQISFNVNQPSTGAIICWGGGFYDGSDKYGHVGVVERVNDDGTVDYTDAYTKNGRIYWSSNTNVSTNDIAIKRSSSPMHPYKFKGYIYILDAAKIEQENNEEVERE